MASVVKPLPEVASGAPKLLAHQFFENSLGSVCAPSHSVTGGADNMESASASPFYLAGPLALGWTLVIPDHEGPLSAYLAPVVSGRITLRDPSSRRLHIAGSGRVFHACCSVGVLKRRDREPLGRCVSPDLRTRTEHRRAPPAAVRSSTWSTSLPRSMVIQSGCGTRSAR